MTTAIREPQMKTEPTVTVTNVRGPDSQGMAVLEYYVSLGSERTFPPSARLYVAGSINSDGTVNQSAVDLAVEVWTDKETDRERESAAKAAIKLMAEGWQGGPDYTLVDAVCEWANCREAEVTEDGEVRIAGPQADHWLGRDELVQLVCWLEAL
jgi:hypothetical protein